MAAQVDFLCFHTERHCSSSKLGTRDGGHGGAGGLPLCAETERRGDDSLKAKAEGSED